MDKNLKTAFTYMFEDNNWIFKLSILTGIFFIPGIFLSGLMSTLYNIQNHAANFNSITSSLPLLIIALLVSCVTYPLFMGYIAKLTHNIIFMNNNHDKTVLPEWEVNFWDYYSIGIKLCTALLILALAMIIPAALTLGLFSLYILLIQPAMTNIFSRNYEITAFLTWKKGFILMLNNFSNYFVMIITGIIVGVLSMIIEMFFQFTKVEPLISFAIMAALKSYVALVFAYLIGTIEGKGKANAEIQ